MRVVLSNPRCRARFNLRRYVLHAPKVCYALLSQAATLRTDVAKKLMSQTGCKAKANATFLFLPAFFKSLSIVRERGGGFG